jgi:hypothetical protein
MTKLCISKTDPIFMTNGYKPPRNTNLPNTFENGGIFEIEIKELLEDHWQKWFEEMTLIRAESDLAHKESTVIRGHLPDQTALHGLLAKIRDLNLTVIPVHRINPAKR